MKKISKVFFGLLSGSVIGINSYSAEITYINSGIMDEELYGTFEGANNIGPRSPYDPQSNNNITVNYISDTSILSSIYGGYLYDVNYNADTNNSASYNTITIIDSHLANVYGGFIKYSIDGLSASNNTIEISNSDIEGSVFGGYGFEAHTNNNTIIIKNNSTITQVYGGFSATRYYSPSSSFNTVTIESGSAVESVFGGSAESGNVEKNTINLYGHIDKLIVGGRGTHYVGNNTINLYASATLGSGADIYGARASGGTPTSSFIPESNNLNLFGFSGSFNSIQYIDNLNFFSVPLSAMNNYSVVLTTPMDLNDVNVHVDSIDGNVEDLQVGDTLKLISSTTNTDQAVYDIDYVTSGLAAYDFDLDKDDVQGLSLRLVEVLRTPSDYMNSLLSGQLAELALINQGSDQVMQVMDKISLDYKDHMKSSWNVFSHINGGQSRYANNPHFDLKSSSLVSGVSFMDKRFLFGMFAEAGWGDFNTVDEFNNESNYLNSDGSTRYAGGGLFGRYLLPKGFYMDVSARLGKLTGQYNVHDKITSASNINVKTDSSYYGAQLGLGHQLAFNKYWSLGFSSHFLWSHQTGQVVTLPNSSQEVSLSAINSQRLRSMAQLNYMNKGFTPYIRVGYDREFDSLGQARYNNQTFNHIGNLRGNSGLGGIGFNLTAGQSFFLNVGAQGYIGQRQGYSASASFQWRF